MRLMLLIALLAGGVLRAEDPWIGTWQIVWASASHNFSPMTIANDPGGLRRIGQGQVSRAMRRLDRNTAEYTADLEGRAVNTRCTLSPDGKELTHVWKTTKGEEQRAVFDRIDTGAVDAAEPMAGLWMFNEAKTALRYRGPVTIEAAEPGGLRFRGSFGMNYTAAFDGKDHPVTGNSINAQTVTLKRIDGRQFEATFKDSGGKEAYTRRVAVSEDGNLTRTMDMFPAGRGHHLFVWRKVK